jgi:S1-C subfamily serine protease
MNNWRLAAITVAAALLPAHVAAQQGPPIQLKQHPEGAEVSIMAADGPAASLGLKVGDIVMEVGGKAISREWLEEYMSSKKEGDPVSFKVKRAGAVIDVTGKAPPPPQG